MITYERLEKWNVVLDQTGLGTLESLLSYSEGVCVSSHLRGETRRITLSNGQEAYLKRDFFTYKKEMVKDLLRFSCPEPKTEKERRAFCMVNKDGFCAPEVICWGQERRWGFPNRAAMVMLPLKGVDLERYLHEEQDVSKRQNAIRKAEQTLERLQQHGYDWPDHKPEHFWVMEDGRIGLIDLERLRAVGHPLSRHLCESQLNHFRHLLPTDC